MNIDLSNHKIKLVHNCDWTNWKETLLHSSKLQLVTTFYWFLGRINTYLSNRIVLMSNVSRSDSLSHNETCYN